MSSANNNSSNENTSKLFSGSAFKEGVRDLLGGILAGFVCKIAEYPFDTMKVLMQTNPTRYTGGWDCLTSVGRESGYMSLYKGLASPLVGSFRVVFSDVQQPTTPTRPPPPPPPLTTNNNPVFLYL